MLLTEKSIQQQVGAWLEMNEDEIAAYYALGDNGARKVVNPAYCHDEAKAEADLKDRVKRHWQHRDHFPKWVKDYIAKWKREAERKERAGLGALPGQPSPEAVT